MKLTITKWFAFLLLLSVFTAGSELFAQGVTTSGIYGKVTDRSGSPLPGANIVATHVPSGTVYGTTSREDGEFNLPGLRVGGPYTLAVSFVGYARQEATNIMLQLSQSIRQNFSLSEQAVQTGEVVVTGERSAIMNADRTGAATAVSAQTLRTLPTISRRIEDFIRLTPQYSGVNFGFSFAGQDNRLNNTTVDGSYFNNSFGLAGQPGDRTGVAPISLDAIEQVQVNVAPYDVRHGNFVGAGVNTVTKSGTNEFSGSAYYRFRNEGFVGKKAGESDFDPGTFEYSQVGATLGGPIIPNKLFFFGSFENEEETYPATTWRANNGGEPVGGTITRVNSSDLDALSNYLQSSFGYTTGPYQGYEHATPALRFIGKIDFNMDESNKFSVRYNHLDSDTDVLVSTSSSLGGGSRRSNQNAINFANSNYKILENIRSIVGEWNSIIGDNMSNNLIIGYNESDESREPVGTFFPLVDIREGGLPYTTFGFEPFTPNNELRYNSLQFQDNFTMYLENHFLTFGLSIESYESENVFFPGSQSVYVYNSLQEFYDDAADYLLNPNRTVSPVTLNRFQVRYMNIPGLTKPVQPLEVLYAGIYAQDEWQVNSQLRVTAGIRLDRASFGDTGYQNANADALSFVNADGESTRYPSKQLPEPTILFSPRVGFNYDLMGDRTTQIRGGSGLFSGRPAYVWISNQIGNTGVLTGFESLSNVTTRPFHPDPNHYKPTTVTGAPATSYELALTDPDFKFPQLWRSNIAIDQQLPQGIFGTAEFLYSRDVNGIAYHNANLPAAQTNFVGADNRPRWTSNRIHGASPNNISSAIVLSNQDEGYSWNFSVKLERPYTDGLYAMAAYSYGEAKNTVDPGSIASGSWTGNEQSSNPNNPAVAFSDNSPGHRLFGAASYRAEYFNIGATTFTLYAEAATRGNYSYRFSSDMNGDGAFNNDLIYIHRNTSEMNFQTYTSGGTTYTAAEQADAWNAFIEQDPYLSENRGKYAERGAAFLPMVFRADLSVTQEVFTELFGKRNSLEVRADFLNITNLINNDWGVAEAATTTTPLIPQTPGTDGVSLYRLARSGSDWIRESFRKTASEFDVFRVQLSIRYAFN